MKKDYLIPLGILAVILAFSIWNNVKIQKDTARWSEQLQQAVQLIPSENWDAIDHILNNSYNDWHRRQTYLHIVLEHDTIDDADAMYRRAFAFVKAQDPKELQAELADLQDQLGLLVEMEKISLENIL
jgi:hypothetical protein